MKASIGLVEEQTPCGTSGRTIGFSDHKSSFLVTCPARPLVIGTLRNNANISRLADDPRTEAKDCRQRGDFEEHEIRERMCVV
jgi:hypothetical protein